MTAENPNYLFSKMSTVLSFPIDGISRADLSRSPKEINLEQLSESSISSLKKQRSKIEEIDMCVRRKVKEIIQGLKASHAKFNDPDFGPTENDPKGAMALYGSGGSPAPAGTNKYPSPDTLRWDRPQYLDTSKLAEGDEDREDEEVDEFADDFDGGGGGGENEVWCMNGELFKDGSGSGDVVQGKLGDCWFLGALSVLGTNEALLQQCFWQQDAFKEFGLFVCCFHKDAALRFVIIDDRIPVFATSGKVVFGQCKDPDELWVPLIEKAYAKLHGCYKALIGGYVHLGLADLTGFVPRLIGLKPGYMGYSDNVQEGDHLWDTIRKYLEWGSLMGTSIQSKVGEGAKVEANAGNGLKMGHAYSFLGCGEVSTGLNQKVKLVRLRNPWGFGEWSGPWSDNSTERERYATAIKDAFPVSNADAEDIDSTSNDGAFFMKYDDWLAHFTTLFVAINFPAERYHGQIVKGHWTGDVGGPREMSTWVTNPKLKLSFKGPAHTPKINLFVGLYINDTRLTLGKEYYTDPLYKVGVSFDIVTEDTFTARLEKKSGDDRGTLIHIPNSTLYEHTVDSALQPPYMFGTTQVDLWLGGNLDSEYYIVPSVKNRKQAGTYFVHIFSDCEFVVEGGVSIGIERAPKEYAVGNKRLYLTTSQFYEKTEEVRERLLLEAKRLGVGVIDMQRMFLHDKSIPRTAFKRRLVEMGFSLADFPDDDFVVLDKDNDGSISRDEFVQFFREGVEMNDPNNQPPPPAPAPDDLVFQPIDLSGVLTVIVNGAKGLRRGAAWFAPVAKADSGESGNTAEVVAKSGANGRMKFHYDVEAALSSHEEPLMNAGVPTRAIVPPPPLPLPSDLAQPHVSAGKSLSLRPTTPYGKMPGGEFISAPSTYDLDRGDLLSPRSHRGREEFSHDEEPISRTALEAGTKLHRDPLLQSTEAKRSSTFLQRMRDKAKEEQDGNVRSHGDNGLLISKHGLKSSRVENRGGLETVLRYLGMPDVNIVKHVAKPDVKLENIKAKPPAAQSTVLLETKGIVEDSDAILGGRYAGREEDIWDVFVDRVAVICSCRSPTAVAVSKRLNSRLMSTTFFEHLAPSPSPIPTPHSKSVSVSRLSQALSTAGKLTPGTATARQTIGKSQLVSTSTIRASVAKQESGVTYVEVFRRLLPIPLCNFSKIDDSLAAETVGDSNFNFGSSMRSWFEFFDKNRDGDISLDEFAMAMRELNANLSPDDMKTLFKRFQTRNVDGLIDWIEFMDFWDNNIHKRAVEEGGMCGAESTVVNILSAVVATHLEKKEKVFQIARSASDEISKTDDSVRAGSTEQKVNFVPGILGELLTLDLNALRKNMAVFAAYEIPISLQNMARLSRVFNFDVLSLIKFCDAMKPGAYENIDYILQETSAGIMKSLAGRCQANKEFEFTSDDEIGKLWCAMAPDCDSAISYDDFTAYLRSVFCDHLESTGFENGTGGSDGINDGGPDPTTTRDESGKPTEFLGISISVLCNLLSEDIFYSAWNRLHSSSKKASDTAVLIPTVSYSAFKAFIKRSHVRAIEQKLQYLVHLQGCADSGSVTYLVHIYIPTQENLSPQLRNASKLDHLLLVAYDPLSSMTFKMKIDGDCSRLPYGERLRDIITAKYHSQRRQPNNLRANGTESETYYSPNSKLLSSQKLPRSQEDKLEAGMDHGASAKRNLVNKSTATIAGAQKSYEAYNPWETPVEDRAMMDLCSRLRLVNTGQKTIFVVSEDPKFISKLRELIDKAALPFFSIVNEVALLFEVGKEASDKAGSVQKLVFGSIRKHAALRNFLVNVISDMRVVISTYDSDVEESMEWQEMLAYLSGNRNPFVTVQLLPKYVHPERGMVKYVPDDMIQRYSECLKDSGLGKTELVPLDEEDVVEEEGVPYIQKGPPDVDGGSHPTWDNTFHINFKPPKLNNCPVLFTDIVLLRIDHSKKYIIVMVRVAEDKSLFMTAYDPRSATEYMLFGGPVGWCLPNIAHETDLTVFKETYKDELDDHKDRLDFFRKQLEDAILTHDDPGCPPEDKFRLGFAITPRLLICVYNQQGPTTEELLGSCQVSISSVLSGTGNNTTIWATLMHEIHGSSGFMTAGALNLQLGYLKQTEIDALREKNHRKKIVDSKSVFSISRVPSLGDAVRLTQRGERDDGMTQRGERDDGSLVSARMKVDLMYAEKLKLEKEVAELQMMKKKLASEKPTAAVVNEPEAIQQLPKSAESIAGPPNSSHRRTETNVADVSRSSDVASGIRVDVSAIVKDITIALIARFKKTGNGVDDLMRPVEKAVMNFVKAENKMSLDHQSIVELFGDLQIAISEEDVQALVEAAGGGADGTVQSSDFINFFRKEMENLGNLVSLNIDHNKHENADVAKKEVRVATSTEHDDVVVKDTIAVMSPASSAVTVAIDWDTHPLPEHWSRKIDKNTNRVYYLNHMSRSTQWRHPLQSRRREKKMKGG